MVANDAIQNLWKFDEVDEDWNMEIKKVVQSLSQFPFWDKVI